MTKQAVLAMFGLVLSSWAGALAQETGGAKSTAGVSAALVDADKNAARRQAPTETDRE